MLRRLREHTMGNFVPVKEVKTSMPKLPPEHVAAMRVPKGGSICSKCEYLVKGNGLTGRHCREKNFIKWQGPDKPAGSSLIPLPIDEYCSDWFDWPGSKKE